MGEPQYIALEDRWENEIKAKALVPLEVYSLHILLSLRNAIILPNHFESQAMLDDGFQDKTKLFANKDYVNVYTTCYNMCTQRSPYNWSEQLYQKHGEVRSLFFRFINCPILILIYYK